MFADDTKLYTDRRDNPTNAAGIINSDLSYYNPCTNSLKIGMLLKFNALTNDAMRISRKQTNPDQ